MAIRSRRAMIKALSAVRLTAGLPLRGSTAEARTTTTQTATPCAGAAAPYGCTFASARVLCDGGIDARTWRGGGLCGYAHVAAQLQAIGKIWGTDARRGRRRDVAVLLHLGLVCEAFVFKNFTTPS